RNKFLLSVDKTTGYVNWRKEFEPNSQGEIFEITNSNNQYLISGIDLPQPPGAGGLYNQGFVSMVSDDGTISSSLFNNPHFYYTPGDIPSSVDINNEIDETMNGRSTSAIFTENYLYWFLVANNEYCCQAKGIADGVVVQMDLQGNMQSMDNFGEIRAYDLWVSGTPTADGGFALITTRHTSAFYDTG